jgi:flagellar basal body-associated protein FliL
MSVKQPEENMSQLEQGQRDRFERELTQAMRPVDAPQGFADRVLGQIAEAQPRRAKVLMMPRQVQLWAGGAIAAALLVGAFGVREQRVRHRREQAAQAQQQSQAQQQFQLAVQITGNTLADAPAQRQFEVAMQITNETLDSVRAQLQQSGIQLGD